MELSSQSVGSGVTSTGKTRKPSFKVTRAFLSYLAYSPPVWKLVPKKSTIAYWYVVFLVVNLLLPFIYSPQLYRGLPPFLYFLRTGVGSLLVGLTLQSHCILAWLLALSMRKNRLESFAWGCIFLIPPKTFESLFYQGISGGFIGVSFVVFLNQVLLSSIVFYLTFCAVLEFLLWLFGQRFEWDSEVSARIDSRRGWVGVLLLLTIISIGFGCLWKGGLWPKINEPSIVQSGWLGFAHAIQEGVHASIVFGWLLLMLMSRRKSFFFWTLPLILMALPILQSYWSLQTAFLVPGKISLYNTWSYGWDWWKTKNLCAENGWIVLFFVLLPQIKGSAVGCRRPTNDAPSLEGDWCKFPRVYLQFTLFSAILLNIQVGKLLTASFVGLWLINPWLEGLSWKARIDHDRPAILAFQSQHKQVTNSIGMVFQELPAGAFQMGTHDFLVSDPNTGDGSEYYHRVTITKTFCMGVYEVTQKQFESLVGRNPSDIKGDELPVFNIGFEDAQEFIEKLNASPAERDQGRRYALPTEAQWEYAARAGSDFSFCFPTAGTTREVKRLERQGLKHYGWFRENTNRHGYWLEPRPVGRKAPNSWGLYDMHGNVGELCSDWYEDLNLDATDPIGPSTGQMRVVRGGSARDIADHCRSARRHCIREDYLREAGFRLVLMIDQPAQRAATDSSPDGTRDSR